MTGYGKAVCNCEKKQIIVEIKALNGKSFNINLKIPESYNGKELEIRNLITSELERGKISVSIREEGESAEVLRLDEKKIAAYYTQLSGIMQANGHDAKSEQIYQIIMRNPDVYVSRDADLDDNEWKLVRETLKKAIIETDNFRKTEGEMLAKDVSTQIADIQDNLSKIEAFETERIKQIEERLKQKLDDYLTNSEESKNRFEQEIIYFLDRLDINEEKTRLAKHCEYFIETMQDDASGNKLGFIAQELGREINTIGSKANHAEIQKLVVKMKDALGKIKEQTLNIL